MKQRSFLFKPVVYAALAVYIALTYAVLAMGNGVIAAVHPENI